MVSEWFGRFTLPPREDGPLGDERGCLQGLERGNGRAGIPQPPHLQSPTPPHRSALSPRSPPAHPPTHRSSSPPCRHLCHTCPTPLHLYTTIAPKEVGAGGRGVAPAARACARMRTRVWHAMLGRCARARGRAMRRHAGGMRVGRVGLAAFEWRGAFVALLGCPLQCTPYEHIQGMPFPVHRAHNPGAPHTLTRASAFTSNVYCRRKAEHALSRAPMRT